MTKETFLTKVKGINDDDVSFGKILNDIQDAAAEALSTDEWLAYMKASCIDADKCEGSDHILLNDKCFDWREFDSKKKDIVLAYLDYFTDKQLDTIARYL